MSDYVADEENTGQAWYNGQVVNVNNMGGHRILGNYEILEKTQTGVER